ncbi:MAG: hemerythrin domain-containing protein [Gammaproteobacteria bacterium]|nr:hemerythrin domain-containing protein [Gammaproteobacteria bacterium]
MNNLLDKLHKDHINFIKLFAFIELQLERIKNCEVVDFETILTSIKYMKDYSDEIHHPLENIIFKYFLDHYDAERDVITQLMGEHENMPLLTEKLINMLQCVIIEMPIKRDEFCDDLSNYICIQKEHMNYEESSIYPALYAHLNDNDWQSLKSEVDDVNDPLFEIPRNESYQLLFNKITSSI